MNTKRIRENNEEFSVKKFSSLLREIISNRESPQPLIDIIWELDKNGDDIETIKKILIIYGNWVKEEIEIYDKWVKEGIEKFEENNPNEYFLHIKEIIDNLLVLIEEKINVNSSTNKNSIKDIINSFFKKIKKILESL